MKSGRTLQELAIELERQSTNRKDFIAPQGAIRAELVPVDENLAPAIKLVGLNGGAKSISSHAHGQFADHLGIPGRYYQRMLAEQPALLAANLNTWLQAEGNEKRMVRTLDDRVRAFMSPKYRPLDNFELAQAVLPVLLERGVQILSSELTETRMYIKGILPALSDELPEGMTWGQGHQSVGREGRLVAAVVISNSDVGAGTLRIEPSMFTTWCTNLAIMKEAAMRKYHVGRANDADTNLEVFRDETRLADDRAFFMKVADVTNAAFDAKVWQAALAQVKAAAKNDIKSPELAKVVEVTVRKLALPVSTQGSILTHLAKGGDLTQWGLSSAITATANSYGDYEGATALEYAGGEVLALESRDWEAIANARTAA